MDVKEALAELGADPALLSDGEREILDRDGYLAIPDALSPEQLEAVRTRLAELTAAEGAAAGVEVHQEGGTDRLADLVNKGEMFDVFYTHPKLLAAIAHVLRGDLRLSSLNARAALPGHGDQGLHVDWYGAVPPGEYHVCNSIWLIDDFTEHNGATRVVPGSHRSGLAPQDDERTVNGHHPDERLVLGKAGTAVVFNSHLWHGGTHNSTDAPRRALHSYFTTRSHPQQLDQAAYLRVRTAERIGPAARVILDA